MAETVRAAARAAPRLLTFTTLFPNAVRPWHGVFVENRLTRLVASGRASSRVVAPVPWFPFAGERFASYAAFARVPPRERRHGLDVTHPRYPVLPKIGMRVAPVLLAACTTPTVRRIAAREGGFDVLDAHYLYPDGVAAAWIARSIGRPLLLTARGSDVNVLPRYGLPRRMILWAVQRAAITVTVSDALRRRLVELGADPARLRVLRNGVDLEIFRPVDRLAVRRRLGLAGSVLLAVGNLVALKGHALMLRALARLEGRTLLMVGDGPEEHRLRALAREAGVDGRVRFVGRVAHEGLVDYYNAADMLLLASSHEGWPNVLLESIACGTPVVAAAVSGVPEIVDAPAAGRLLRERSAEAIVEAVLELDRAQIRREATRAHAERFSWTETIDGLAGLVEAVAAGRG